MWNWVKKPVRNSSIKFLPDFPLFPEVTVFLNHVSMCPSQQHHSPGPPRSDEFGRPQQGDGTFWGLVVPQTGGQECLASCRARAGWICTVSSLPLLPLLFTPCVGIQRGERNTSRAALCGWPLLSCCCAHAGTAPGSVCSPEEQESPCWLLRSVSLLGAAHMIILSYLLPSAFLL